MNTSRDEGDYTRVIPEFIDNNPFDITPKQMLWIGCCFVIALASFVLSLPLVGLVALASMVFAYQTHEGIVYERIAEIPKNRKALRTDAPFFDPVADEEVLQIDESAKEAPGKRASRRRDYSTPFTTKPIGLTVPYFGSTPRGILYDPHKGTDRFLIEVRGWSLGNLDLVSRAMREDDLANVIKEVLSELDGGISFKYLCGSRPRNIYPYAYERQLKTRKEIIDVIVAQAERPDAESTDEVGALDAPDGVTKTQLSIEAMEAELLEELLATEKSVTLDPVQVIEFEVPRPPSWARSLRKRGYLTESEIEKSPLVQVMKAAYEGINALEVTDAHVLDMPSMFTRIRRNMDIGGIDEFLRDIHFASLQHEGKDVPWHQLLKDQRLWPRRIPRVGRDYVLTDQTLHRILRLYRFRIRRVLPGFLESLQMLQGKEWWYMFSYVGRTASASRETSWLTRQIVVREGMRRVFRSGERYESKEEQEHRLLPRQQQDDLYDSRGPSIKANRYIVISVPLPDLSDDIDEAEQLEIGLEIMRLAENQARSKARRLRIISRTVKNRRQLERLSDALV